MIAMAKGFVTMVIAFVSVVGVVLTAPSSSARMSVLGLASAEGGNAFVIASIVERTVLIKDVPMTVMDLVCVSMVPVTVLTSTEVRRVRCTLVPMIAVGVVDVMSTLACVSVLKGSMEVIVLLLCAPITAMAMVNAILTLLHVFVLLLILESIVLTRRVPTTATKTVTVSMVLVGVHLSSGVMIAPWKTVPTSAL